MVRAVVDRIVKDKDMAVLLFGDEEHKVDLPVRFLPEGVREGDILDVTFRIDHEETERQRGKIKKLIEKLQKG